MGVLLRIDTPMPLSLAGPILSICGLLYADARIEPGGVLTVTSELEQLDHDKLDDLMDYLEEANR
jgi:hypothetical protein